MGLAYSCDHSFVEFGLRGQCVRRVAVIHHYTCGGAINTVNLQGPARDNFDAPTY